MKLIYILFTMISLSFSSFSFAAEVEGPATKYQCDYLQRLLRTDGVLKINLSYSRSRTYLANDSTCSHADMVVEGWEETADSEYCQLGVRCFAVSNG